MSIIAFINQKGGVGKSLLSFNIGVILASQNKKVLFVDLDAQSTLTDFAIPNEEYNLTLFDLLKRKNVKVQDVIVHTEKYDIIPVNIEVANPNLKIEKDTLDRILNPVKGDYDYIVIDCPPNLSMINIAALYATDRIISVVKPDIVSTRGLNLLQNTINNEVSGKSIDAVIVNQYRKRKISDLTIQIIKQDFPLLDSIVRDTSALSESASVSQAIIDYSPNSPGSKDIQDVTEELLNKGIL